MSPVRPVRPGPAEPARVGPGFIAAYAAAQVGVFIAFIPFLTLLLPLKAEAIDPLRKGVLLGQVALWGAVCAGLANTVAGMLSDATPGRWGRRRPWILLGVAATALAYGLIHAAASAGQLLLAVLVLQLAINLMLNPLNSILPDRVPDAQKGAVAAFSGLAFPVASVFGALVVGVLLATEGQRLAAVVAAVAVLVLPLALGLRDPRRPAGPVRTPRWSLAALTDHDFLIAFASRLLIQTTVALNVLYLLFFLQQESAIAGVWPGKRPEAVVGWLLGASTAASVLVGLGGGLLSDRLRRRKPFLIAGGGMLAAAAALMAAAPQWPGPLAAQILFGCGVGLYGIVDAALIAELLPSREHAGRDLGVMNLAITAAQGLAPLVGLAALAAFGDNLRLVFAISAVLALAGAVIIVGIRRSR